MQLFLCKCSTMENSNPLDFRIIQIARDGSPWCFESLLQRELVEYRDLLSKI